MQETATTDDLGKIVREAVAAGHDVVIIPKALHATIPDGYSPLVAACCRRFGLTLFEARTLVRLLDGQTSKGELLAAMMSRGGPRSRIVDVHICRIRRKLSSVGIEIITLRREGLRLAQGSRDRLLELLAEDNAMTA